MMKAPIVLSDISAKLSRFLSIFAMELSSNKILAVLISNSNDVENKIFDVDPIFSDEKLNILKNYLNEHFEGVPINEIPNLLKKGMTTIRNEINALLKILTEFVIPDQFECIVNGQSKLVVNNDLSNIQKIKN